MLIGYARVSTSEQNTDMQRQALERAGVTEIVEEKASGVSRREALQRLLDRLCSGDIVVVYKLDRVARSLQDLLSIMERIGQAGAGFRSLTETVDTATPAGRLMLQMLGAVAEFERSLIRERSIAGQVASINRGVRWGRPTLLTTEQEQHVWQLWFRGKPQNAIAADFGVSRSVVARIVNRERGMPRKPPPVLGRLLQTTDTHLRPCAAF